jgi:hypothetical protein
MSDPTVDELFIADEPSAWRAAGFSVERDICRVGGVTLRLEGPGRGRGIVGWSLRGAESLELDGLESVASAGRAGAAAAAPVHPNGAVSVDHLVVITPHLDRTVAALRAAGFDLRRTREGPTPGGSRRQAFFRTGELILEVVEAPEGTRLAADRDGPARLWGISFLVEELAGTAAALGDLLGAPRDAVQPGRRIATLRREAGLGPAIAFMSPGPGAIPV